MSNFNFNKVIIGGRLTSDPELRQTTAGVPVISFIIAANRKFVPKNENGERGERVADFITCVAWRQNAEHVSRFYRKGSSIAVVGSLQSRSWVDQQGQKRFATDVVVEEVYFVDSAAEARNGQSVPGGFGSASPLYGTVPYQGSAVAAPGVGAGDAYNASSYGAHDDPPKFEEMANDDDLPF